MKRAFTLVELSIVLIIIGLLLVVSYNGYLLYYEAEARKDIHKINQFRLAVVGYIADKKDMPPIVSPNSSVIDKNVLLRYGFLTNSTFISNVAKTDFVLRYCNRVGNSFFRAAASYDDNVCAVLSKPEKVAVSNYEILADDGSLTSGLATVSDNEKSVTYDIYKDKVGVFDADYFMLVQ